MRCYKIFTEDKNRKDVERLVAQSFDAFSIYKQVGYWKGQKEKSIVIEIIQGNDTGVYALADAIKTLNKQQAVLVTHCLVYGGLF